MSFPHLPVLLIVLAGLLAPAPPPALAEPCTAESIDLAAARDEHGQLSALELLAHVPTWLEQPVVFDNAEIQGRGVSAAGSLLVAREDARAWIEVLLFAQGVLLVEERAGSHTVLRAVSVDRRAVTSLALHARRVAPDELPDLAARRVLVSVRLPVPCGDARSVPQRLGGPPPSSLAVQPTPDGRALDVVGVSSQVAALWQQLQEPCH